ncbi:TldD/PmbA family protein [bacterium]|nr:TldD/PmbA family protein [bacterium]
MDQQQALDLCDLVLQASRADQTEVVLSTEAAALTRFANNAIHQNVAEEGVSATVRAVVGQRVGVASSTDVSPEGLRELADAAYRLALVSAADEDFVSLPGPLPYTGETDFADAAAAACDPEQRAATVAEAIALAAAEDFTASGACSTGLIEIAVANSLGVRATQRRSMAEMSLVVSGAGGSGYARTSSPRLADISGGSLGRVATAKCRASRDPQALPPGEYTVILEAEAVADMVMMLSMYGLGALAVQEGRSFVNERLGEKICGDNITIWDDGLDPRGHRLAYDFEGVPKQRVPLITGGVAEGVVWDSYTAHKEGRQSTGHGLPAPNSWGPVPINLLVAAGDSSVADMIAQTQRGVLVTRFHYTNMIHPIKTVLTGMTRDGTFLIEDGQIAGAIKNLRFTQSILEALSCVSLISRDGKLADYVWAPAMRIDRFTFSSATEF